MSTPDPTQLQTDVIVVGAGPVGLQAAILARNAGLRTTVLEKGCIVNAIAGYPTYMTFFTTAERLEIGNHPLVTASGKPINYSDEVEDALSPLRSATVNLMSEKWQRGTTVDVIYLSGGGAELVYEQVIEAYLGAPQQSPA